MVRLSTVGGSLGVIDGGWTLVGSYLDGVAQHCPANGCSATGVSWLGTAIVLLSVGLILNSVVSFFWHRRVLYVSAFLSALVGIAFYMNASQTDLSVLWVTVVLSTASAVCNLVAARSRTRMSEQTHPMNLPVFG